MRTFSRQTQNKTIQDDELTILTSECITFLTKLHERFEPARQELLEKRREFQVAVDAGILPKIVPAPETDWKVAPIPEKLWTRTVELIGPINRKILIHGLNSGSNGFCADFEDALVPTWSQLISGQAALKEAINDKITYYNSQTKSTMTLKDKFTNLPTLHIRPRGLHLNEPHFLVNGQEMSGSLFDFAIYFFHNAKKLIESGHGPNFYLAKLQTAEEGKWWNDIFVFSQNYLGIPIGTIKATIVIEHVCLAFYTDSVVYELRDHCTALTCGRWDYIFSFIKKFHKTTALPDKNLITMKTDFMAAYNKFILEVCEKRGIYAMGGMAAELPVKGNNDLDKKNTEAIYQDKVQEALRGMDGVFVAHPGLVHTARQAFVSNKAATTKPRPPNPAVKYTITEYDLMKVPSGPVTEECVKENVKTSLKYLDSWLKGVGAVAIGNKMEDVATAEMSRIQLWNWINHRYVNGMYVRDLIESEKSVCEEARKIMLDIVFRKDMSEFLTWEAYPYIKSPEVFTPRL